MVTTTHRKGSKTKAALCAGAALAMLIGGASTYAAWSEAKSLPAEDSTETIEAGSWTVELSKDTVWYDASPDVKAANSGDRVLIPDITAYNIVPGDVFEADVTIAVDTFTPVGPNLQVDISDIDAGSADPSADVSWLAVSAKPGASADQVTIVVEFPFADGDPEDHFDHFDAQAGEPAVIDLSTLSVTVTQVR